MRFEIKVTLSVLSKGSLKFQLYRSLGLVVFYLFFINLCLSKQTFNIHWLNFIPKFFFSHCLTQQQQKRRLQHQESHLKNFDINNISKCEKTIFFPFVTFVSK